MLQYTPRHFAPQELISPSIYGLCGDDALYMFHPLILEGADVLRDVFGPMIANTWHSKKLSKIYGYHRFRGLRAKDQKLGAKLSPHKIGIKKIILGDTGVVPYSGIDLWPVKISVLEMHTEMKKNEKFWVNYFTRIETHKPNGDYITWFHGDNRPDSRGNPIRWFKG